MSTPQPQNFYRLNCLSIGDPFKTTACMPHTVYTVIAKFLVDSILIDPLQKPAPPPLHVTMELLWSFRGMQLLIVLIQVALFTLSEDTFIMREMILNRKKY